MKNITIETKHFGNQMISESQIFSFPAGILAFEDYKNYTILSGEKDSMFFWLQSIDDPKLAFLIVNPANLMSHYVPDILAYDVEKIFGSIDLTNLAIWCIVTIPYNQPEKMTVNLQGPLIISTEKRLGGQFISNNDAHQVRMPVLELVEAGEIA